jgi:hypothetical protein
MIDPPNVMNVYTDTGRNVRYEVFAYRALTADELRIAVACYLSERRGPPRKGFVVKILTIIGFDGRIGIPGLSEEYGCR